VKLLPEASRKNWSIEHFNVSEEQSRFDLLRSIGRGRRYVPPGRYMRLMRGDNIIMSNTPSEMRDLYEFRRRVTGDVLINGLGLGIATQIALATPEVSTVTVIEISENVIQLVAPHIADHRVTVIHDDAFKWSPSKGKRWNVVWHDIWDDICADNLEHMARLYRRYGRRCDWQGSWCRAECERAREMWRKGIQKLPNSANGHYAAAP
jgi:hypothetical protein